MTPDDMLGDNAPGGAPTIPPGAPPTALDGAAPADASVGAQPDGDVDPDLGATLQEYPQLRAPVERTLAGVRAKQAARAREAEQRAETAQREADTYRALLDHLTTLQQRGMQSARGDDDAFSDGGGNGRQPAQSPDEDPETAAAEAAYAQAREAGDIKAELAAIRKLNDVQARRSTGQVIEERTRAQMQAVSKEEQRALTVMRRELNLIGVGREIMPDGRTLKTDHPFYATVADIYERVRGDGPLTEQKAIAIVDRTQQAWDAFKARQAQETQQQARRQAGSFDAVAGQARRGALSMEEGPGKSDDELFARDPKTNRLKYVGTRFYPGGQARIRGAERLLAYQEAMPRITAEIQAEYERDWTPNYV